MQFFHLHFSVWNKMKGKCFWLKPGMSPQPPASALCHIDAVQQQGQSAHGLHLAQECILLKKATPFILQGGSPWASQCLLLHQKCCYIVNWKVVLFPWNPPGTIPWVKSYRPSTSTSSTKLCIISSCTLPSSVLCAQTSLQPQKGQEQGYMHSGYVQQWKNWSKEQVSYLFSRIHLFPSRTLKPIPFKQKRPAKSQAQMVLQQSFAAGAIHHCRVPLLSTTKDRSKLPKWNAVKCVSVQRGVSRRVRDRTAGLQSQAS